MLQLFQSVHIVTSTCYIGLYFHCCCRHPSGCEMVSYCDFFFDLHSLVTKDIQGSFTVLIGHLYILLMDGLPMYMLCDAVLIIEPHSLVCGRHMTRLHFNLKQFFICYVQIFICDFQEFLPFIWFIFSCWCQYLWTQKLLMGCWEDASQ